MRATPRIFVLSTVCAILALSGVGLWNAQALDCSQAAFQALNVMTSGKFDVPASAISITSAVNVAATPTTPAHCAVQASWWPETKILVKLPVAASWNQRMYYNGGGGWDGSVSDNTVNTGLNLGCVSAMTNGGHDQGSPLCAPSTPPNPPPTPSNCVYDTDFGYNPPDNSNPNARQKLKDFGYRAHYEGAAFVNKLIKAYYGVGQKKSYYVGCSNGGREGWIFAQRFPEFFDGYVIGNPMMDMFGTNGDGNWRTQVLAGVLEKDLYTTVPLTQAHPFSPTATLYPYVNEKQVLLTKAVLAQCDGKDGLVDGLVSDPEKCTFVYDEMTLKAALPMCADDTVNSPTCFTTAQVKQVVLAHQAPHNSSGQKFTSASFAGYAGPVANDRPAHYFSFLAFDPPPGSTYNWLGFNWDLDPPKIMATDIREILDAMNPDLWGVKHHGAKIIYYHGAGDTRLPAVVSLDYYKKVRALMGGQERTDNFFKFYMPPGMDHCGGGTGCSSVDWFSPLVNWVENGVAPESIVGNKVASNVVVRSMPHCPYPQSVRYIGSGDVNSAASFTCVKTDRARVSIERHQMSLASGKTSFNAFVGLPHRGDWRATSAVCEGALATKLTRHGNRYEATFNKQDLKNIVAGDKVAFVVTLFGERRGRHRGHNDAPVAFEGNDTVKVTP
jgi:feruloyl esterase